jgi:glycerol-3-phosphate acyltransferase PlsY
MVFLFIVGYASMATMSMGLLELGIFTVRAIWFGSPWEYIIFGFFAMVILFWALKPNILRLLRGEERLVGWRARVKEKREEQG